MLESPTGTGKTLSLLCAITAFIKKQRELGGSQHTTLIYCTRTHSQIQQVMDEIKNNLPYHVKATIVASKTKLCINDNVRKGLDARQLENKCSKLRSSKRPESPSNQDLEKNLINERPSACQFYQGGEMRMV
jgi:Rad3-related DNA helicase